MQDNNQTENSKVDKVIGHIKKRKRIKKIVKFADLIYCFLNKLKYDHVTSFAGHSALFLLMSLFPMIMYIVSMFRYIRIDSSQLFDYLLNVLPDSFTPLMNQIVNEVMAENTQGALQSFTILITLFCASKGVYALIIGMNAVYGLKETRGMIVLYAIAIIYVLILFATLGLLMFIIVLGNNIFRFIMGFIPDLEVFEKAFHYGKYGGMLIFLIVFFLILYMNMPNRKSKLKYELPGAIFATIVWLVFSWGFSFYISRFSNYSVTYGSLATIVIFMVWIYSSMNILFIGAEINVVLRKYAEYGYNYENVYYYYEDKYEGDLSIREDIDKIRSKVKKKGK